MAKVDDPQNVESNLRVLASLPGQKSGAKVNCDASTGRLSIGKWALSRSASDSVTSREFSDRMKALFRKAYRDREKYSTLCANALVGFQWLQKNSYANDSAKQKSLQKVLDELAILKREADEREETWRIQEAQIIRDLRLGDVAMLDPALERFCQAVFDQRDLMGAYLPGSSVAPADVAGLIYNLYIGLDPGAKAARAELREWKEWSRALFLAVQGKCPPGQPYFMGTDQSLQPTFRRSRDDYLGISSQGVWQ